MRCYRWQHWHIIVIQFRQRLSRSHVQTTKTIMIIVRRLSSTCLGSLYWLTPWQATDKGQWYTQVQAAFNRTTSQVSFRKETGWTDPHLEKQTHQKGNGISLSHMQIELCLFIMNSEKKQIMGRLIRFIPNQPHLLNKYQINTSFSYFRGIGVLSGINISVPYQIDVVKLCGFIYKKIIFIWFFYQLIMILKMKTTFI